MRLVVLVVVTFAAAHASADARAVLRVQVVPLQLDASSDTPLFGDRVDRAVAGYNRAAAAHDRATGDTTARIAATALGVDETLVVLAPGLEADVGHYLFRIEGLLGLGGDLRSYGLGLYPLGVQAQLDRGVTLYGSAGGTASWLDRPGGGDRGGLVTLRVAVGARFASYLVAELGYSPYAFGGTVNTARLEDMLPSLDAMTPLPEPSSVISAGDSRGIFDVSLGFSY